MAQVRKYLVAGGTFSVAMAIGFVMQNGDALASRMVAEDETGIQPLAEPVVASAEAEATDVPYMPEPSFSAALSVPDAFQPADPPTEPVRLAAVELDAPVTDAMPQGTDVEMSCAADMSATAGPAATVMLELSAPCAIDAVGTLHHQGMIVSVLTDSQGKATVMVPALAQEAVFIADMPGGFGAAAIVSVPDFAQYDRAVLQWQGDTGLGIHALEFGAGYQEDGHVWAASARSIDAAQAGTGGFLMRMGDVPIEGAMIAEVYTYPSGISQRDGTVELSVEAEVQSANCGRAIAAQSIQIIPGAESQALDLTMTMPDCDAIGEFLVLKNMLRSLTLASR
ncbi:hypothetical protein [Flavimaricola marinus]|uniref:Translocase n=1 Tax=Flavimaricola marinus TaxID=1819565 RepID=A0A238LC31_9RHOB|nr:hypothetical protein [Flavimaricola marinus]SMY07113.1 hypothetical protein LOM8899_01245 [Flavimaricola marinus]